MSHLQRRDALLSSGAAAGILLLKQHRFALAAQTEERVIPWVDQPPPVPPPAQGAIHNLTPWERLDSWITPNEKFFYIAHYEVPKIDPAAWRLDVARARRHAAPPDAGRSESPAAARGDLYLGMFGKQRIAVFHERGRQRAMGRYFARRHPEGGTDQERRPGSRVLRRRQRRGSRAPGHARRSQVHRAFRAQHVDRGGDKSGEHSVLRNERRSSSGGERSAIATDRSRLVRHRQRQMAEPHRGARYALSGPLHGP